MTFEVERDAGAGKRPTETLTVTPDDTPPRTKLAFEGEAVDVAGLGLCYPIRTRVGRGSARFTRGEGWPQAGRLDQRADHAARQDDRLLRPVYCLVQIPRGWDRADRTIDLKKESPGWFSVFMNPQYMPDQGSRADRQQRVPADQDHARDR